MTRGGYGVLLYRIALRRDDGHTVTLAGINLGKLQIDTPLLPFPYMTPQDEEALLTSGRELSLEELLTLVAWPLEPFTSSDMMKASCVDDYQSRTRCAKWKTRNTAA